MPIRITKNRNLINWIQALVVSFSLFWGLVHSAAAAQELSQVPSQEPSSRQVVQPALTFDQINSGLESVLHTINEIGYLILDFVNLIKEDPLEGLLALLEFIGEKLGLLDGGDGIAGPLPIPGPGLANQSYPEADLFKPVGWINHDNGLPGVYSGRKAFGTNLGMMIDGYFFTLFAPDSGKGPGGFLFYDVSDPYQPRLMRRIYEPEARTAAFREPHAFGMARINGRRYMAFQSTVGVEFWDFTDLNDLQRVGEINLPGVNGGDYSNVSWQLTWQAPYVYVASSEQGIFIVDAGDPANPRLAERDGSNPIPVTQLGGFRVGPIFTFGNQLVIASMENRDGMASLDISDPVNPRLLDRIPDLQQFYYASCFNGRQVAVSVRGAEARMELYDLTNPENFTLTSDQLAVPGQLYCAFQDHYVFQGAEDRVHKIDIHNPAAPFEVGSGTISGPLVRLVDHGQVSPLGNLVFVGNDHGTGSAFMPHDTAPDLTPPQVVITAPRDQADNVNPATGIGISFSDVLDFDSVSEASLQILDPQGLPIAGTYSQQNGIVNFMPHNPLQPFTRYRILVSANGVTDVMGNAIAETFTASFTTGANDQSLQVDVQLPQEVNSADYSGEQSQFDAVIAEPLDGAVYEWNLGDGTVIRGLANPAIEHSYTEPGHYQVLLTIRWQGKIQQVSFIKTIVPQPTAVAPVQTSTIAHTEDSVFIVNPDNGTVTALEKANHEVRWETPVGTEPQSIALDSAGQLWVTAKGDDQLIQLNQQGDKLQQINLPYGAAPFALVCHARQPECWASLQGSGQVIAFNLQGNILAEAALPDPRAMALSGDGFDLWVTRLVSADHGADIYHLSTVGGLTLQDTIRIAPDITTSDSQDRARGISNYLFDIAVSPSGNELMVPAKKDNQYRGLYRDGQPLDHDKTVRALTQRIATGSRNITEWDFDNRANPRAVAYSPLGDYAFIALQGSNKVIVMDVFSGSQRVEIETGLAPQGLAIDANRGLLYVHEFMSRSVSVFDIGDVLQSSGFTVAPVATVNLVAQESLSEDVLLGKQIFYNADDPRMSRESYMSCASCHVDGGHDGRVWDFTERGEGLRNTIPLKGRAGLGHGNVHWTANFDEIQDFENDIRNGFGGTGFLTDEDFARTSDPLGQPKAGLSEELDAMAAYVSSLLSVEKSPYKTAATEPGADAQQGQQLFSELNCGDCHSGSQFTDGLNHPIATWVPGSGQAMRQPLSDIGIETPTLLGLWNSAPYFHHGQALTLNEVIDHPGHGNAQSLSDAEKQSLITYLLTLDGRTGAHIQGVNSYLIRNGSQGCLSVAENRAEPGAGVIVDECHSAVRWWQDQYQRIHLSGQADLCLAHNGKALYWSRVTIEPCSDAATQQFDWRDSGHIHWQGNNLFVLDAFGTGSGARVGSWWRHQGSNQLWSRD